MIMSFLPARKGRHRQRYENHLRLVAGCIPYRLEKDAEERNGNASSRITVLMISTPNRDDLVFPKGGWEDDETVREAACREALEEAGVKGILDIILVLWTPELPNFFLNCMPWAIDYGSKEWEISRLDFRNLSRPAKKKINSFKYVVPQLLEDPLGVWEFRSKSRQNSCSLEGGCRGYMFALEVTEELDSWAEQTSYKRKWLSPEEAYKFCRYDWMRDALQVLLTAIKKDRKNGRAEKLVELPMFPASDALAEHQMLSAGCSGKPSSVQHLEESFTNKCIVQG